MHIGFKGKLLQNIAEAPDIFEYFQPETLDMCAMMHHMFALPARGNDGSGGVWTKGDWLCLVCVCAFVERNMVAWWLEVKRAAGKMIPGDCQWGYNCRIQTLKLGHAKRWNHFCDPTTR